MADPASPESVWRADDRALLCSDECFWDWYADRFG